jgi:hypothetical protein
MAEPDAPSGAAAADRQAQARDREALLRVARARFRTAEQADATWRAQARDDFAFLAGQQWPDAVEAQRTADGRPCLTINQLPQFVRQVVNEERQNRPSITVQPVDDQADVATAEVIEGLIRQIQNASNADIAYDTAADSVAACGLGYLRVNVRYVAPMSFDQEPTIERVLNPLSVYLDPTSTEPTGADANWAFLVQVLAKDVYEAQYGRLPAEASAWETTGDAWITPDTVRVAEYYWREWESVRLALLADGTVQRLDQLPEGAPVVQTRTAQIPSVHWATICGYQVLEQTRWLGSSLPLVRVTGEERLTDEGQLDYTGVVRHAKDSQYAYDLWASAEAEMIALAPKAPFILAEGQIEGYDQWWDTANTRNHAYLPYKPLTIGGVAVPPPQRQTLEPPVQAIAQARLLAAQDLSTTTGIYQPQLGQQGPPGEAASTVYQQRTQGQLGQFHYLDNLRRSVRRVGQILVELIPKLYDGQRALRIIGADDTLKQVIVGASYVDPVSGLPTLYDLTVGRYDVVVSAGPGYATKRQEAVGVLMQLTQALPQVMQYTADVLIKNLDMPGGQALAERLQKLLPPELQEGKEGQPSQAQQIQQLQQAVQQMTGQLEALNAYAKQAEAAMQELTQRNNELELQVKDKTEANALKARELEIEREYNVWQISVKEQELALKAQDARNGQEG